MMMRLSVGVMMLALAATVQIQGLPASTQVAATDTGLDRIPVDVLRTKIAPSLDIDDAIRLGSTNQGIDNVLVECIYQALKDALFRSGPDHIDLSHLIASFCYYRDRLQQQQLQDTVLTADAEPTLSPSNTNPASTVSKVELCYLFDRILAANPVHFRSDLKRFKFGPEAAAFIDTLCRTAMRCNGECRNSVVKAFVPEPTLLPDQVAGGLPRENVPEVRLIRAFVDAGRTESLYDERTLIHVLERYGIRFHATLVLRQVDVSADALSRVFPLYQNCFVLGGDRCCFFLYDFVSLAKVFPDRAARLIQQPIYRLYRSQIHSMLNSYLIRELHQTQFPFVSEVLASASGVRNRRFLWQHENSAQWSFFLVRSATSIHQYVPTFQINLNPDLDWAFRCLLFDWFHLRRFDASLGPVLVDVILDHICDGFWKQGALQVRQAVVTGAVDRFVTAWLPFWTLYFDHLLASGIPHLVRDDRAAVTALITASERSHASSNSPLWPVSGDLLVACFRSERLQRQRQEEEMNGADRNGVSQQTWVRVVQVLAHLVDRHADLFQQWKPPNPLILPPF